MSLLQTFADANLWPGLGRTLAGQLQQAGIVDPEDVSVATLSKLDKVGLIKAGKLMEAFQRSAEVLDVLELLLVAGLEPRLAGPIARVVRIGAAAALRADPWRMLEAPGTNPPLADRLARALEVRGPDLGQRRAAAIAGWCLRDAAARGGHTALDAAALGEACGRWNADLAGGLEIAVDSGALVVDDGLIALERYAMAEQSVAEGLARLEATADAWGSGGEVEGLDAVQAGAVAHALQHGVSILTGGPGTGKSHTVAAIVKAATTRGKSIALAAPTGRAAKRLEELAGHPASTLHRLLEAQRLGDDGEPGGFNRDEEDPLDADLIVVDEASMLDAELAAALVEACPDETHLVLVGDPAQLPSVGAGRVLGDLIDAGHIPSTELTTLYRQAEGGAIARLAAAVRTGELPAPPPPAECGYEVVVLPVAGSPKAADQVVPLVTRSIPDRLGIAPGDVQVVTPVHKGPAGTIALNRLLKAALNPGPGARQGFDVGDRVVATANKLDAEGGGYANGEIGLVTDLPSKGGLEVAFPGGEVLVLGKDLQDLVHGWCLTVHRAQGSEWPAVVVVLPTESGGLLSRPLVYTGMTRAQRHLSVVSAVGASLPRAVSDVGTIPRVTRLSGLVAQSLEELEG